LQLFVRLVQWLGTHLTATVITLVGIVAYSTLNISYTIFYGRFDVDPHEVGLGQKEILLQTGLGLAWLIAVFGAFLAVIYFVPRFFARNMLKTWKHGVPPNASLGDRLLYRVSVFFAAPSGRFLFVYLPIAAITVILLAYSLPSEARDLADKVEKGEIIRPPNSLSADLHVKALSVRLVSRDARTLPSRYRSSSLRYLGEANGTVVLYDWKTKETFRVAASNYDVITSK
jgi:hypothetical protein